MPADAAPLAGDPPERSYRLRPAQAADLAAAEALLAGAGLTLNDVAAQFGPQYAVAVAGDETLVGVAGVEVYADAVYAGAGTRVGLFRSAAVRADWRGRGVGTALTVDRLAWARAAGLGGVYLLTQTAAGYWPRFGFVPTDRAGAPAALRASSEWAGACPASATAMRLDFGASARA